MNSATLQSNAIAQVIHSDDLTVDDLIAWRAALVGPPWDSPFLTPDFIQQIGRVRSDVRVARIETHDGIAFFPFQQQGRRGVPVGFPLNDFQGVIARPRVSIDNSELLAVGQISRFDFNHWITGQPSFAQSVWAESNSPYADLSGGFAEYEESLRSRGGKFVKRNRRDSRKLAREVGPLRFEFHTTCPEVLSTLIRWKRDQLRRSGLLDFFSFPWVMDLCDELRFQQGEQFRGILSALYAGDRLVAAHFGLGSSTVAHHWITAYDPDFRRYSPGMILLLHLMEELAARGYRRLDFGKGGEEFKESCKTGDLRVAAGMADRRLLRAQIYRWAFRTKHWIRSHRTLATIAARPMRSLSKAYRKAIMR